MQVQKLRVKAEGLAPVGAYFAAVATKLEVINTREAARQEELEEEDRALEAMYRRRSPGPLAQAPEQHAMM